jgi:hypothetical protein
MDLSKLASFRDFGPVFINSFVFRTQKNFSAARPEGEAVREGQKGGG